jgi:hydroxypyruvate reductase
MGMAGAAEQRIGEAGSRDRVSGGLAVVPDGYASTLPGEQVAPQRVEVVEAGHPVPNAASERAGRRLLQIAEAAEASTLVVALISGGGTALTTAPAAGVDRMDLRATFRMLLESGAPIGDVNVVRKHLTRVGGGQLARAAHPGDVGALVVSDVVGDDLSTIASGPTVPDASTYTDAVRIIYRLGLWHDLPSTVREHLSKGANDLRPATPPPGDAAFDGVRTQLVATNDDALRAAKRSAEMLGYDARILARDVTGEARDVALRHVDALRNAGPNTCLLWGGETTVTVTGNGTGGRNQELALAAALAMDRDEAFRDREAALLSGGTDGIDGPTDAAGAVVTPETAARLRDRGTDPQNALDANDSYTAFQHTAAHLLIGPTHTNVMDVHLACTGRDP